MMAIISAICFGLAFLLGGLQAHTNAWFAPVSLIALGGFCLALHATGAVTWPRR